MITTIILRAASLGPTVSNFFDCFLSSSSLFFATASHHGHVLHKMHILQQTGSHHHFCCVIVQECLVEVTIIANIHKTHREGAFFPHCTIDSPSCRVNNVTKYKIKASTPLPRRKKIEPHAAAACRPRVLLFTVAGLQFHLHHHLLF